MTITKWVWSVLVAGVLLSSFQNSFLWAGDDATWPQWRGPKRDGSVIGGSWPDTLQAPVLKKLWREELPPSYSGTVVSTDKVFVTYTRDEMYEGVRALNRNNGKQVWQSEWKVTMKVAGLGTGMGSWIRATPAYEQDGLFVAGMPDLLVSLDPDTGAEQWRADFHARYGTPIPELGFVCSPLVVEDGVYVQTADSFVKVDRKTGRSVWRCMERKEKGSEGMGQGSYSSPDFAVIKGRPQLLVADIDAIAGVDPVSGKVLWNRVLDSYDQGCILAPIVYGNGIFTSTRASRTGHYPLVYGNGQFSLTDGWKNKLIVYMSSPIIMGDFAYLHLKNGRFACVDLRDGKINWISNRPFGKYCSMVWLKDRILGLTDDGRLLLIQADPDQFILIDSRHIASDETWGHLAIVGQDIYIRERNAVTAYRWQ